MKLSDNVTARLVSLMIVVFLPVEAFHLDSNSPQKQLTNNRHVRSVETPSSSQPQQSQESQQQQQQLEPLDKDEFSRMTRFVSTFPLEKLRYFLPAHPESLHPSSKLLEQRWNSFPVSGSTGASSPFNIPRTERADSNFIRFGRSFSLGSKKNNFIRLGRENPRQNNFIRLGRSGPWDSSERGIFPRVGFFPENYYYGPHWTRPAELSSNVNQEPIPSLEDLANGYERQEAVASRLG